jgi:glycerophosphoryl diester phosphodiesterase
MKLLSESSIIGILLAITSFSCQKKEIEQNILVFGHAGTALSAERYVYPPNTTESMLYALDVLNADGVEIDVQLSEDSTLFCYHNGFLQDFTNAKGCISEKTTAQLKKLEYYKNYSLRSLDELLSIAQARNKYVLVDFKRYDYCKEAYIDYSACNIGLNKAIELLPKQDKKRIIASSNDLDLLTSLSDSSILKSFETRDVLYGIKAYKSLQIDFLTLHLEDLTQEDKETLNELNIKYILQGVKIKSEIKKAQKYLPFAVISDNIALTNKKFNQ